VTAPQQQVPPRTETEYIQAVAILLAAGGTLAATETALVALMAPLKLSLTAIRTALRLAASAKMSPQFMLAVQKSSRGGPVQITAGSQKRYQAAYLITAAKRIHKAELRAGLSPKKQDPDLDTNQALAARHKPVTTERLSEKTEAAKDAQRAEALKQEKLFLELHKRAQVAREKAAIKSELALKQHGKVLGWYAVQDGTASAECAAAHGHNFNAGKRPIIGYPGSVHPYCRCNPGPAWADNQPVDIVVHSLIKKKERAL